MIHGITGIDHAIVAVAELDAARRQFEKLGFTLTPRGSHPEWGTGNLCIMFPEDYLELLGSAADGPGPPRLNSFLRLRGEGVLGLALASGDADASRVALESAGLHPKPVRELTRDFEIPIQPVQLRFSVCSLDEFETPGLGASFLCQHRTPELIRSSEWLEHPNRAVRVSAVTAVVSEIDVAEAAYRRLFGTDAVERMDGGLRARVGQRARIEAVTSTGLPARHPGVVFPRPVEPPFAAAITIESRDLDAVRQCLSSAGIPAADRGAAVRVGPEDACGVILEFVQE